MPRFADICHVRIGPNGLFGMVAFRRVAAVTLLLIFPGVVESGADERQYVQLPAMLQQHMLSNMRDHLAALNDILSKMAAGDLEGAAEIAETRLGMSSLESHGAEHMATFMPEDMRNAGIDMHRAASRFALKVQEGEALPAYGALSAVTEACVACHSAYRIR